MSSGLEHHGEAAHHHGPRVLPGTLVSPELISSWRTKALIACGVFTVISLGFLATPNGGEHVLRAYLHGFMTCFGFAGGGLAMLMLQYVSGGKWGMIMRRPLEAMTRTLPLVALMFLPVGLLMSHLYSWAKYTTDAAAMQAVKDHAISLEEALCIHAKRIMLSPISVWVQAIVIFAVLNGIMFLLNKWSIERDADPEAGTESSFDKWRVKFENLSGPGIFVYVVLLTAASIEWIKSLDVTWYSSIYGLQFLVGQGYSVLALGILTLILLSRVEPIKTLLRTTEQHDLGKFAFAFTMLNIYLTFAEFLIIWSGNVPDEIPWYLNRIHGGWWMICSLDFVAHWLIPFCLLLSRDLKRNKTKMVWLASWMIFARLVDMFWLIEPNFKDAAGNLHISGNISILAYVTVPLALLSLWAAYYLTQLNARPLVNVNDPHLEELLEPEHAH